MARTEASRQAIWLRDFLSDITRASWEILTIRKDNQSAIALTRNPVFHGHSKHIHTRYHFTREFVEKKLIEVEHVPGNEQKVDILTKALGRIKYKEMRELVGVHDLEKIIFKLKGENVGVSLKKARARSNLNPKRSYDQEIMIMREFRKYLNRYLLIGLGLCIVIYIGVEL